MLKYAIKCLFWDKTVLIAHPETSVSTKKGSSKLGRRSTEVAIIAFFKLVNDWFAAVLQVNPFS